MTVAIHEGDALEVLRTLDAGSADCILTDPPYSSGARRDAERQARGPSMLRTMADEDWFSHDTMTTWGFSWFMRAVFNEARRILRPGAHVYCFCDWRQTPNVYAIMESAGYRVNNCLVWRKTHFGLGATWRNQHENIVFASLGKPDDMANRAMGSVLDAPNVPAAHRCHPTEKPLDLLTKIVGAIGAEHIVDPFMGSGTTGLAAVAYERAFTGIEINPAYVALARQRLADAAALPLFDHVEGA